MVRCPTHRLYYSCLFLRRLLIAGQPTWKSTKERLCCNTLQRCRRSSVLPPPSHSPTTPKSSSLWSGAINPGSMCLLPFQMSGVRSSACCRNCACKQNCCLERPKNPNSSFVHLSPSKSHPRHTANGNWVTTGDFAYSWATKQQQNEGKQFLSAAYSEMTYGHVTNLS